MNKEDEALSVANDCLRILEFAVKNSETVENNRHKESKLRLLKDVLSVLIIALTIIILNMI
ncbi:MAG: hypothetical protein ACI3T9_02370 [Romboutsia timonensis]